MYREFVDKVDPRGYILDVLIQHRVVKEEIAEQLRKKESRQERCESMVQELLKGEHPQAFIALRTALQQDCHYIVEKIDGATTGALSILYCQ